MKIQKRNTYYEVTFRSKAGSITFEYGSLRKAIQHVKQYPHTGIAYHNQVITAQNDKYSVLDEIRKKTSHYGGRYGTDTFTSVELRLIKKMLGETNVK